MTELARAVWEAAWSNGADIALLYPDDAPLPYTYPTPEGGISMEWSAGNNAGILEIDLDAHSAEWLWFDRDSDDECERTLNMDESADWRWLASEIRSKLTTGAA